MNFVFSKKTCHRTAALMVAISFMSLVAPVLAQNSVDKLNSDELVKAKAALEVIHDKLSKIGKTQSQIQLVDSDEIDIQTADDDKGTISLSTALVLHFRDDRDAVASLIARQQASQRKKPVAKQETKKSPTVSKLMDMVGSAVSSAVDAKVGISGCCTNRR